MRALDLKPVDESNLGRVDDDDDSENSADASHPRTRSRVYKTISTAAVASSSESSSFDACIKDFFQRDNGDFAQRVRSSASQGARRGASLSQEPRPNASLSQEPRRSARASQDSRRRANLDPRRWASQDPRRKSTCKDYNFKDEAARRKAGCQPLSNVRVRLRRIFVCKRCPGEYFDRECDFERHKSYYRVKRK